MIARSWFESALEGSWFFPFFGVAEGAENFADVGGFGAGELFGNASAVEVRRADLMALAGEFMAWF